MRGKRPRPCWIPLAMTATLIGRITSPAQDWQTVDDFAFPGGDAEAHGVAVDAAGRIYVVGTASRHGIVRYSADDGSNWTTRDDFLYPSEANNVFNAITVDPQGALFVAGASGGHWIIRRSTDQGVSWETVDDYYRPMNGPDAPGTNGVVYSLSSDAQGRVYGAGLMLPTGPSYLSWWVRGSGIGGTNWDTKLVLFSGYAGVSQLTCAGQDVYVIGGTSDSVTSTGLILRSSDYGTTWTTNFESMNQFYYAINSDSAGNVYSAGNSSYPNSVDWLVRKATPGGTNWTTLDSSSYNDSSGGAVDHPNPASIAADTNGNISVTGRFLDFYSLSISNGTFYGNNQTWFTRQYSVSTRRWNTTDTFSYSTNVHGVALGTAIAPDGSTFVVGYGTSDSGQRRWVVRKRAAPFIPPDLQIARGTRFASVSWPAACTNSILQWTDSTSPKQVWQSFTGAVIVVNGRNTATFELSPGPRFFRLKSSAGQ